MGVKRVMIQEEKRLFDRRIRDEENDYYRKRQLRDEIDQNKRQFIHMKLESQRIIENQQRQNYQMLQEERYKQVNEMNDKVSLLLVLTLYKTRLANWRKWRSCWSKS